MLSIRETDESKPEVTQWVKNNFNQLCSRIGKSKNPVMLTQFKKDAVLFIKNDAESQSESKKESRKS